MFSAIPPHTVKSSAVHTPSTPGLKGNLPAVLKPWSEDFPCPQQRDPTSLYPEVYGEGKGFCCQDSKVEELFYSEDGGGSGEPQQSDNRRHRRSLALGDLHSLVKALVPALFLALLLALIVIVVLALKVDCSAHPAGRQGESLAAVLACPEGWVGYRGLCYYLSKLEEEEGSWEWSRERCSALGASLAVLSREWELEFLWRLKGNVDYWVGLQGWGERLERVDGSSFNQTVAVQGQGACLYLNDRDLVRSSCSLPRPYLCSKLQARVLQM